MACPRAHSVRIQARFMSETRLRLSSKATLRQKTRERALLQCWPKSCTGSPRPRVGRRQQDGSRPWSSICQSTMWLPHPRSTVCTALGEWKTLLLAIDHATGNLFSEDGRRIFICAAILGWRANTLGFGDRQPCPRRSRHSSDGVARYPRGRGTACWRSLQALIHNAGISPPHRTPQKFLAASVESGMRLTRLNLLGMILLPQDLFLELKATSVSIVNVT